MIFTLGLTEGYKARLKEATKDKPLKKMGRREDYPGGSVWKTYQDASIYLSSGFSVFGVLANWETETIPSSEGNWNDLLVDAEIIDLEDLNEDWPRNYYVQSPPLS